MSTPMKCCASIVRSSFSALMAIKLWCMCTAL